MSIDNPWADAEATSWPHSDPVEDWGPAWVTETQSSSSLDALLRHCDQVSQEIWPPSESTNEVVEFDNLVDVTALLAQLAPSDPTLPPPVQFSTTATAKAMNEALKLTRHLPVSASSPLSHFLAARGALEWQKSIKTQHDILPDTSPVGWRVLEKEDRLSTLDESKSKKATSGFLSFWNRRTSAIQSAPPETPSVRSGSPARSSLESAKSIPHPPSSRAASPPRPSTYSVPPPPPPDPTAVATAPAPSVVSRFLNRFSRTKSSQHTALALSSDDLEFLSDIVPSASDLPDEDAIDSVLGALTGASSPLPKLPPSIPPPPKQPTLSGRSSLAHVPETSDGTTGIRSIATTFQVQGANQTPKIPILAPPLSPKPAASFSRTQSPFSSAKDVAAPTIVFGQSSPPSTQGRLQSSSQPDPLSHSSFTFPPPQKVSPLSIPPLLPPPPVSPPQTPRPSAFPLITNLGHSSTPQSCNPDESDDEFTAFTSFSPPVPNSYPQRSPSPPSPPPRRTYDRTHYPSSSSASSILSPASQSSVDHLCSTQSPISASLDSFDGFVSPASVVRGENKKHTPPPPLPAKSGSQPPQLYIATYPSYNHHAHTPSETLASPTMHTSLMASMFSAPSVSDAERQRTQALVDHAATHRGSLWPNSPVSDGPSVKAIPPPRSSSMSPKPSVRWENSDLLSDNVTPVGVLEALPTPLGAVGDIGMHSVDALLPYGVGHGSNDRRHPSSPFTSAPTLSLSSPGTFISAATASAQQPRRIGGLSPQDLSFFEG